MRRFCRRGAAIGALSTVGLLMALPGVSYAQPVGSPDGPPLIRAAWLPAPDPAPQLEVVTRPAAPPPYIVVAGDTLWALGGRTHRSWEAWAGFNHLANPDLITVGEALNWPPLTYEPPPASLPPVSTETASSGSVRPAATVQAHTYQAPAPTVSAAPGSFQACVEFRESTDGAGSSDLYGILPSTWSANGLPGSPYTASPAEQAAGFNLIYSRDGTRPWAPYDGC